MGFQYVAFLPTRACFSTTFHKTVVGGKQGHASCKILLLHKTSFGVSLIQWRSYDCYKDDAKSGHPQLWGHCQI